MPPAEPLPPHTLIPANSDAASSPHGARIRCIAHAGEVGGPLPLRQDDVNLGHQSARSFDSLKRAPRQVAKLSNKSKHVGCVLIGSRGDFREQGGELFGSRHVALPVAMFRRERAHLSATSAR
jgi:hypothetical protein